MEGEIQSGLTKSDESRFYSAIQTFFLTSLCGLVLTGVATYVQNTFAFEWRRFITQKLVDPYFGADCYYHLTMVSTGEVVDNPDQRIGQDVAEFVPRFVSLCWSFVGTTIQLFT